MKKIISIVLLLAMVLGLVACGESGSGEEKVEGLQIGYAKINATPKEQVPLAGYGNADSRKNTDGLADYIYTTCIAVKEGDETILLFTLDMIAVSEDRAVEYRNLVSEATGIPKDKMFFGATHCHSSPSDTKSDGAEYRIFLNEKVIEAAKAAIADLSPATISAATTQTERMTFVRHYLMADGSYAGSNFGDLSKGFVKHTADPDEQMIVVKFERAAEDKKDVVLVNFQAHNDNAKEIGFYTLAAGYVGPLRDKLEELSGCNVAFFTGASGNLNADSRMEEDNNNLQWREYGQKLGQIAYDAMANLKPVEGTGISTTTYKMTVEVEHSWDNRVADAQAVKEMVKTSGNDAAGALAKSFGFTSIYQANAIVSRSGMGATDELTQSAIRIHNLGFIVGSYEMFCNHAMAIKKAGTDAGYDAVFVISGNQNYIPTMEAFQYRSYEGDTCRYVPGTGEKLQDKYIELLKGIQ